MDKQKLPVTPSNAELKTRTVLSQSGRANRAGIGKMPGTVLQNERTGETVYTQPEGGAEIRDLFGNLETYIKGADTDGIYPLIKLAVIHYQLESIHPFYTGNFITATAGQAESSIFFTWY